jgi:CheY-like chemotaxis protein
MHSGDQATRVPRLPLAGMRLGAAGCHAFPMAIRCLLVDDSDRFIRSAKGLLERQGMAVVGVASSANEALARAQELHPDVMLLDIDLGGESGFDLARRLDEQARGLDGQPHPAPNDSDGPQVILISSYAEEDFGELIAASPVAGFLGKSALSAGAIRELLCAADGRGDSGRR